MVILKHCWRLRKIRVNVDTCEIVDPLLVVHWQLLSAAALVHLLTHVG